MKSGATSCAREEESDFAYYKTPVVILIYTIKSGKSLCSDRGQKITPLKVKYTLPFEIWIFRICQPDCDGDRIIFIVIQ